jgi:hypothetical protein
MFNAGLGKIENPFSNASIAVKRHSERKTVGCIEI